MGSEMCIRDRFKPCNLSLVNGTVSFPGMTGKANENVFPWFGARYYLYGDPLWLWTAAETAAILLFDCLRTAVNTAAENFYLYFDFYTDNELRCGHHEMFRKVVARGMRLCERVPPDPTVALALFATQMRLPVDVPIGNFFRFLRCRYGTLDDLFGYSVNNPRTNDWYADASMAVHYSFQRTTCVLWKTEMICSTDPMFAWQQRCLWLILADSMLLLWVPIFLRTLEYDPRKQILYRNGCSTTLLFRVATTFGCG